MAKKMKGYQFLEQRSVLNYIADFMCKELQLVIEVDGYSHSLEGQWNNDKSRQKELEDNGFSVLRFWDDEVFNDLENVHRIIEQWIESYPPAPPFPKYKPSGQARGTKFETYIPNRS